MDKNTEQKMRLNFARLLVEEQIGAHLPDAVFLRNGKRMMIVEQPETCHWKPSICASFQKYGLPTENCRKNKVPQKQTERKEAGNESV